MKNTSAEGFYKSLEHEMMEVWQMWILRKKMLNDKIMNNTDRLIKE